MLVNLYLIVQLTIKLLHFFICFNIKLQIIFIISYSGSFNLIGFVVCLACLRTLHTMDPLISFCIYTLCYFAYSFFTLTEIGLFIDEK